MRTMILLLAVAAAAWMTGAASAQESSDRGEGWMARFDKNGDGAVSKDEWTGRPGTFDRLDADGDGKVDAAEMDDAREILMELRGPAQERRGERRGQEGRREGDAEGIRQKVAGAAMFAGALFQLIDTDRDGKLSNEEVDAFAAKIKEADADKDSFVTRDEARDYIRKRLAARLGEAFLKKLDTNADGKVTRDEFKGEDKRFQWLDANSDGVITLDDFEKRGPKEFERRHEGQRDGRGRGEWRQSGEGRRAGGDRDEGDGQERPRRERADQEKKPLN